MADLKNDVAQQRRAGWVGLRTLRQRPKVVDHTADGEPVYEVRSVRLVLRPDAGHFNRLVECAKCGREVPGAAVLDVVSLDHPSNPVICKTCVQGSAIGGSRPTENVVVAHAAPPPASAGRPVVTPPAPAAPDDGRLATLEAQLRAVVRQLRELADRDRTPIVDSGQPEERIQAQVHEAVRAELAAVRDTEGGPMAALADQVRRDLGAMAEALQVQRRDLSTLVAMVEEARGEVERVDRRVAELTVAPTSPPSDVMDGLDARVAALTDMVEAHRREVAAVMQDRVPPDLSPLLGAVEDRIGVLVREAAEQRARMDALLAAGARRLQEVEQRMQDDVGRLTGLLEGQRRGLQSVLAVAPAPPPIEADPDGDDLLDVLERQLLEAERRLAHRSIRAGSG